MFQFHDHLSLSRVGDFIFSCSFHIGDTKSRKISLIRCHHRRPCGYFMILILGYAIQTNQFGHGGPSIVSIPPSYEVRILAAPSNAFCPVTFKMDTLTCHCTKYGELNSERHLNERGICTLSAVPVHMT